MRGAHGRHLAALAALALAMAWLYGEIDYAGAFAHVDLRHYRVMAQEAPRWPGAVPQPFIFRPLGPWLAGLLPLPDPLAFRLLSVAGLLALLLGTYGWLAAFFAGPRAAAFTAALLAFNPYAFGFFAFNYFQLADVLALLALLAAFAALQRERWGWLALALALGVLAREPAVLVIPAVPVLLGSRRARPRAWRDASLAVLPALLLFVGLRLAVEPAGGPGLLQTFLNASGKAARPETWYRLLINAWAPLSLLPLVFWGTTRAFARAHPHLVLFALLVLASAFFGGDQERLVVPAFVAVYALVAVIVERHLGAHPAVRAVLVAGAFATSLHHLSARFPLPSRSWSIALSVAALLAVTAAAWWARRHEPEAPLRPSASGGPPSSRPSGSPSRR